MPVYIGLTEAASDILRVVRLRMSINQGHNSLSGLGFKGFNRYKYGTEPGVGNAYPERDGGRYERDW